MVWLLPLCADAQRSIHRRRELTRLMNARVDDRTRDPFLWALKTDHFAHFRDNRGGKDGANAWDRVGQLAHLDLLHHAVDFAVQSEQMRLIQQFGGA